jgi:hypothetical protein
MAGDEIERLRAKRGDEDEPHRHENDPVHGLG